MPTVVNPQPVIAAVKAAVEAAGVPFGDARKPTVVGSKPYVVAWFDAGTVGDRSLLSRDGFSVVGTFHSIGLTPEAARIAARAVRAAVLGLHDTVIDGRTVLMPVHLTSLPMQRDDDADPVIFDQVDEWRIRTA